VVIETVDYSPFCFREALIAAPTTLTRCCGGGCVFCVELRAELLRGEDGKSEFLLAKK